MFINDEYISDELSIDYKNRMKLIDLTDLNLKNVDFIKNV